MLKLSIHGISVLEQGLKTVKNMADKQKGEKREFLLPHGRNIIDEICFYRSFVEIVMTKPVPKVDCVICELDIAVGHQ